MNQLTVYYGNNDYRDYLAHHGILGQRKGVRHGPPYPLGYEDHNSAEKRGMMEKGVRYMGAEGSEPIRKKRTLKDILTERKAKKQQAEEEKLAKKKKQLVDEAVAEGTAANIQRNKKLFTPEELKDISRKMDEQAEASRMIAARSSDVRRKAETRQKILESGDAKKILKNMDQFSAQELNEAAARIAARQKIKDAVRNERLKSIETLVQKGASITKSVADIAVNANKIKELIEGNNAKKQQASEADLIKQIIDSGRKDQIAALVEKKMLTGKQAGEAVKNMENQEKLNKAVDEYKKSIQPTGDGTQQPTQQTGGKKDKKKDKQPSNDYNSPDIFAEQKKADDEYRARMDAAKASESKSSEAKSGEPEKKGLLSGFGKKKEEAPKQEEKKTATSAMDMIPESFRKDAAERAASYKEHQDKQAAEAKAEAKAKKQAEAAAQKEEKRIKRAMWLAGGETEYLTKQREKQLRKQVKAEKKAAEARDEQNRKIKEGLQQQLSKYASTPDSIQDKVQKSIRALQNGTTINEIEQTAKKRAAAIAQEAEFDSQRKQRIPTTKKQFASSSSKSASYWRSTLGLDNTKSRPNRESTDSISYWRSILGVDNADTGGTDDERRNRRSSRN